MGEARGGGRPARVGWGVTFAAACSTSHGRDATTDSAQINGLQSRPLLIQTTKAAQMSDEMWRPRKRT